MRRSQRPAPCQAGPVRATAGNAYGDDNGSPPRHARSGAIGEPRKRSQTCHIAALKAAPVAELIRTRRGGLCTSPLPTRTQELILLLNFRGMLEAERYLSGTERLMGSLPLDPLP